MTNLFDLGVNIVVPDAEYLVPYGYTGSYSLYCGDSSWSSWTEVEAGYIKFKDTLNQMKTFEVSVFDITASDTDIAERNTILIFQGINLVFKGRIESVEYTTDGMAVIKGYGHEASLLDKEISKKMSSTDTTSDNKRQQFTNIDTEDIVKQIISTNGDGSSPWDMSISTNTNYGDLTIRFENTNKLKALADMAYGIEYDWWVSESGLIDNYKTNYFNIGVRGSQTPVTSFEVSGASQNMVLSEREKDTTELWNHITILGYGDGINQIKTSIAAASPTYSRLSADITSSATTVSLTDAGDFAGSGEIIICEERITYTGKSGNDLTGCTRGANSTTAKAHRKNVVAFKYADPDSAEADSSIDKYGKIEKTLPYKEVINEQTLELIASREILNHFSPVERIVVVSSDPSKYINDVNTGDYVSISDSDTGLTGNYRVVSKEFEVSEYGEESLKFEVSNKRLEMLEEIQKSKEASDAQGMVMQGATNIYAVNSYENCDSSNYLNMRFYIPGEAVAINKVKLNFKLEDFRAYSSSNASESSHTHDTTIGSSGSHTHSVTTATSAIDSGTDQDSTLSGSGNASHSGSTWRTEGTISVGSYDSLGLFVWVSLRNNDTSARDCYSRLYNFTDGTYFPSSSGRYHGNLAAADHCSTGIFIPGSNKNDTCYVQGKISAAVNMGWTWRFQNVGSHTHSVSGQTASSAEHSHPSTTSTSGSAHTHGINYGIYEESLTSPSVDVYVGEDGGSMTKKDTYNSNQSDIDITSLVTAVGSGNWINIQFRPNKRMRIEANAYVQIFIDSR